MTRSEVLRPAQTDLEAITWGPAYHFFGYYDKCPWDKDQRRVLALETSFMDRRPGPDDVATIGIVDGEAGNTWNALAATRAWNWQQGCMLQWLPSGEVIYNDRDNDRFVSVIHNIDTGARRVLPLPIYAVSPDGRSAVTLNFSRLFDVRPGYGYAGVPDPWADVLCPADDGIYHLDLESGDSRLIVPLAQIAAWGDHDPTMETGKHRFNHLQFNPDGSRFVFLHRWSVGRSGGGVGWKTRVFTANPDGTQVYCLSDHDMVSHFDWRDPQHLLAWAHRRDVGNRYFLFEDQSDRIETIGENVLTVDGHCSYAPDRRWVLTDTYPDRDGYRTLLLWDTQNKRRVDVGRFHGPTPSDGEIRCDLHPRWSRDGKRVCIDSIHEGARQMYVVDVEPLMRR